MQTPSKTELIQRALALWSEQNKPLDKKNAVMIGDRKFDIEGARGAGIDSIGVLYGYGAKEELQSAGATFLADTPDAVAKIVI